MLFSSMIFLWVFLPVVLAGNWVLSVVPVPDPHRRIHYKNLFLLIASLVFYGFGGIPYLFLMLAVIGINYLGGALIGFQKLEKPGNGKACLIGTLAADLGILFVFKYLGMFANVAIELPIGISFYTFQAITYVVDVYRGKVPVQRSLFRFALYVSLFPQLIAGPIVQYGDVEKQLTYREEAPELTVSGIKRFCYGLGKKVLLANTFGAVADHIWETDLSGIGAGVAWLGMICYTLQIYYDFSGYSDMAIGLGRIFGFSFRENFNYPYLADSVQDFWRRWHMSLSGFFRDYVYIPLGGSREGRQKTYRNIGIVFLLTGIWHGANYTFWLWGVYYGILLIAERAFLGDLLKKNPVKILNRIYALLTVMIGWVMFRSDSVADGFCYLGQLFAKRTGDYGILSYVTPKLLIALPVAVLCGGLLQQILGPWREKHAGKPWMVLADRLLQLLILIASIFAIAGETYNPFIYFQF